jgi:hypothetical protein
MSKLRSIAVATALAATMSLAAAPAAHALHSCALDEYPALDQICESHGTDLPIIQKLLCLVLRSC